MITPWPIRFDYDKAAAWPDPLPAAAQNPRRTLYRGYEARPLQAATGQPWPLLGIVLHSTEGAPGESFDAACGFIRDSPDVSAHYYVPRFDRVGHAIQRILDPGPWLAYHAGVSRWAPGPACNLYTVGIELHHTHGGPDYTPAQLDALAGLCRQLMHDHPSITRDNIALHRWVALPAGRKPDPTDRDDAFWHAWIAAL